MVVITPRTGFIDRKTLARAGVNPADIQFGIIGMRWMRIGLKIDRNIRVVFNGNGVAFFNCNLAWAE